MILFKNFLATGSPFELLYGFNPQFPHESAAQGFGHTFPQLTVASQLLWSEYRGLFFWNPILLMALPGAIALARANRAEAVMILAVIAICFVEAASFHIWYGGNTIGPRYLSPALPFLGFVAAHGIQRLPKTGAMLAVVSIMLMAMVTAVTIDPAQDENAARGRLSGAARTGRFRAKPRHAGRTFTACQPGAPGVGDDRDRVAHHGGVVSIASPGRMVGFCP